MKVTTSRAIPAPVRFVPKTLEITFHTQQALDAFTAVCARTKKIPDAMFHEKSLPPAAAPYEITFKVTLESEEERRVLLHAFGSNSTVAKVVYPHHDARRELAADLLATLYNKLLNA